MVLTVCNRLTLIQTNFVNGGELVIGILTVEVWVVIQEIENFIAKIITAEFPSSKFPAQSFKTFFRYECILYTNYCFPKKTVVSNSREVLHAITTVPCYNYNVFENSSKVFKSCKT